MKYIFLFLVLFAYSANALAFEAGPDLTDREIIESLVELKAGQANLDNRLNDVKDDFNRRFDNLGNLVLWGFGIIFTGIFALIGFVLWDRRTALAPAVKRHDALENALIGYSEKHPDLKEELKHAGVL